MAQAEIKPRYYTPAEYFALEAQSNVRHEYFEGEVFAMVSTSIPHNLIKDNLMARLRSGAQRRGCRLFDEKVRLAVQESKYYTYPNVMAAATLLAGTTRTSYASR